VNGREGIAIPTFEPDLDNANVGNGCFSAHKNIGSRRQCGSFFDGQKKRGIFV